MILTEAERRMFKAYNIGYLLSQHEPALIDKIIKGNPKSDFVKMMAVGRDHHHFNANIPRKDHSPQFRNGFHNGRTLAEHQPGMIERLIDGKGFHKDYKRGLEAAQKEYEIGLIGKKLNEMPKVPAKHLRKDEQFQKGFNVGYRLSENHSYVFDAAQSVNEQYTKFLDGINSGRKQYAFDLAHLQEKEPGAKLFPDDRHANRLERVVHEHKANAIRDVKNKQIEGMERTDGFENVNLPKWLQKRQPGKNSDQALNKNHNNKHRSKGLDR